MRLPSHPRRRPRDLRTDFGEARPLPDAAMIDRQVFDATESQYGSIAGVDRERQERGVGAISSLLVDFEHAVRRSMPDDGVPGDAAVGAGEAGKDDRVSVYPGSSASCDPLHAGNTLLGPSHIVVISRRHHRGDEDALFQI